MMTITYERKLEFAARLREYVEGLGLAELFSITINFHTLRTLPSDDDPTSRRDVEITVEARDPAAFVERFLERHGGGHVADLLGVWVYGEASTAVRWRIHVIPAV